MPNPFRHRPQADFARPDRDDAGWENRDRRYDEGSSWSEGDGGRTAEAFRNPSQGSDQYTRDRETSGSQGWGSGQNRQSEYGRGLETGWTGDRGPAGGGYDAYGSRGRFPTERSYQTDRDRHATDYGHGGSYGGSARQQDWDRSSSDGGYQTGRYDGYPRHAYAPGSQIWDGPGRDVADTGRRARNQHDFEPDYLHWRDQQLSNFDRDYTDWRSERREKFSSDFDSWRSSRPRVQAENPIVGDVTDGGTGDASEARKR